MPTLLRYLFFQIPGWVVAVVVALGLLKWDIVPSWLAVLGIAGWVVKDLAFYPLLRSAYEAQVKSGSEAMVGKNGVALGDLSPEGYIRVTGEMWRAIADPPASIIAAGTEVDIVRAEGMRLVVRARGRDSTI